MYGAYILPGVCAAEVTLTVSAAASLKDGLAQVKEEFKKIYPDVSVTYNFGASGALQQQIEAGAPVDVFVSAANKQIDALEAKRLLLPGTRAALFKNQLALAITEKAEGPKTFAELASPSVKRIAVGDPGSVPAGQYAAEVFEHEKIAAAVAPKLVYGKDVTQCLAYLKAGEVDASVVYLTDPRLDEKIKIVAVAPPESHTPIVYSGAVVASTRVPEEARAFLGLLKTTDVFQKLGFEK